MRHKKFIKEYKQKKDEIYLGSDIYSELSHRWHIDAYYCNRKNEYKFASRILHVPVGKSFGRDEKSSMDLGNCDSGFWLWFKNTFLKSNYETNLLLDIGE